MAVSCVVRDVKLKGVVGVGVVVGWGENGWDYNWVRMDCRRDLSEEERVGAWACWSRILFYSESLLLKAYNLDF